VFGNCRHANAKEFRHAFLGKPQGLIIQQNLNPDFSARRGIKQEFRYLVFNAEFSTHNFLQLLFLLQF